MNITPLLVRLASLLMTSLAAVGVWAGPVYFEQQHSDELHIYFFDVGQGDAIFIETPDGAQALIDGGRGSAVLGELGNVMSWFDRDIDLMVATHQDSDHIGGLNDVLARFTVERMLMTENESDSVTAESFNAAALKEEAEIFMARRGQVFTLGASTTLEVLFPEGDATEMERNASSIVLKLSYGDTSVLLTGDAPKRIEEYLVLTEGEGLESDVLKVGHHGSRTSTSELFVAEVAPSYAVISTSADNRYGHPHSEVTDALFNAGVTTLSTAEEGTILFTSDGTRIRPVEN